MYNFKYVNKAVLGFSDAELIGLVDSLPINPFVVLSGDYSCIPYNPEHTMSAAELRFYISQGEYPHNEHRPIVGAAGHSINRLDPSKFKITKQTPPFMSKDFQWTDDLVRALIAFFAHSSKKYPNLDEILNDFKASRQPKKEWEITAFKNKDSGDIDITIDHQKSLNTDWWLKDGKWDIFAVRRLSDGEIFTVGDWVSTGRNDDFTITGFEIIIDVLTVLAAPGKSVALHAVCKATSGPRPEKEKSLKDFISNYDFRKTPDPEKTYPIRLTIEKLIKLSRFLDTLK